MASSWGGARAKVALEHGQDLLVVVVGILGDEKGSAGMADHADGTVASVASAP